MTLRQLQEAKEAEAFGGGGALKPSGPACHEEIWIQMHYWFPMQGACKGESLNTTDSL